MNEQKSKKMDMKEQLVTYKTAKLAKEKGFDIPVQYGVYGKKMNLIESMGKDRYPKPELINWNADTKQQKHSQATSIPTQTLLQKWLRDKDIHVWCKFVNDRYKYFIGVEQSEGWYTSYEQALEEGLQEALKLV